MEVLVIDGHPDKGRYCSHLVETYAATLPEGAHVTRIAVRDLDFTPNLQHGYVKRTDWEPDLLSVAEALDACDHVVFGFPMWWGAEPAIVKGLLDRLFLPGFTFAYHQKDLFWDRLMKGRSADVIVTMDTPPFYLRLAYKNALIHRWRKQILGFTGFEPVRVMAVGPIKRGGVERNGHKWEAQAQKMAASARPARPRLKTPRLKTFLAGADPA